MSMGEAAAAEDGNRLIHVASYEAWDAGMIYVSSIVAYQSCIFLESRAIAWRSGGPTGNLMHLTKTRLIGDLNPPLR